MKTQRKASAWRGLVRAVLWGDDLWLRWLLWACFLNGVYQFTPWSNTPWAAAPVMVIVAANGVWTIRILRSLRRQKDALKTLKKQGGFWAAEVMRHLHELELAEKRFATQAEKDEINIRLEEAGARCARELLIFKKTRQ